MKSRKGFTLIELMIVVVIVGILAAIIIPLLLSRVEKAKYSEGKAIAGQIATAVRAYVAEYGAPTGGALVLTTDLGFKDHELDGKYFIQSVSTMDVSGVLLSTDGQVSYVISLTPDSRSGIDPLTPLVLTCVSPGFDPIFTPSGI